MTREDYNEDGGKTPKNYKGLKKKIFNFKVWLYNKGIKTELEYENMDGGTTHRRRTNSFARRLKTKL